MTKSNYGTLDRSYANMGKPHWKPFNRHFFFLFEATKQKELLNIFHRHHFLNNNIEFMEWIDEKKKKSDLQVDEHLL